MNFHTVLEQVLSGRFNWFDKGPVAAAIDPYVFVEFEG